MKKYNDEALGKDILIMLDRKYTPEAIANWAHQIHMKSNDTFTEKGRNTLLTLIAMDQGPEFELSLQNLKDLATQLF